MNVLQYRTVFDQMVGTARLTVDTADQLLTVHGIAAFTCSMQGGATPVIWRSLKRQVLPALLAGLDTTGLNAAANQQQSAIW